MKFTAEEIYGFVKTVAEGHGVTVSENWCRWAEGEEWETQEELLRNFEAEDFPCQCCGFVTRLEYIRNGLCEDCWHERFFECADCHEVHEKRQEVIYQRNGDKWSICRKCASDAHYVVCQCGDYATERKGDYTKSQVFTCKRCKN